MTAWTGWAWAGWGWARVVDKPVVPNAGVFVVVFNPVENKEPWGFCWVVEPNKPPVVVLPRPEPNPPNPVLGWDVVVAVWPNPPKPKPVDWAAVELVVPDVEPNNEVVPVVAFFI